MVLPGILKLSCQSLGCFLKHTNHGSVYVALRQMYGPGNRSLFAPKTDFMSISLLILGIASFLFHATLRHALQFGDELAMLGLTWSLLHGTLTTRQPPARSRIITVVLSVVFPICSAFYIWTGKIIYHAVMFATMIALIIARGFYLFHFMKNDIPDARRHAWRAKGRKALWTLGIGYVLWNIDLEFCAELRRMREAAGLPWAWLLELHGWWHILTAFSASFFMDIVRELREELQNEKEE
jgi:dihydroceramidase